MSAKELREIQDIVTVFVAMNPMLRNGQSMLHLAMNAQTPVDDFHTNDVCQFPCLDVAKLLLCCNARIEQVDKKCNTPLHTLIANESYSKLPLERRLDTVESIVKVCLQFGSHLDEVNSSGMTVLDLAESEEMRALITKYQSNCISLKCLASRVIVDKGIEYQEAVPYLIRYIQLHDKLKGC